MIAVPTRTTSPAAQREIVDSLNAALQHIDAANLPAAQSVCERVLAKYPDEPRALHLLGVLFTQVGDIPAGIELLQRCTRLMPNFPDAHVNLAGALRSAGLLDPAVASARRALDLDPRHFTAAHILGASHFEKGELDQAIAAFTHALSINASSAETMNDLAICLAARKQLDQSIELYRNAIRILPNFAEAHNNLGNALKEKGHLNHAIECYRNALIHNPSFALAFNNLGVVLLESGQTDASLESFAAALGINPDYPEALNNLGNLLIERGRLDEAVTFLQRAIQRKPDFAAAFNNLGAALKSRGQIDQAMAACQSAIRLQPENSDFHSNWVYATLFQPGASEITLQQRLAEFNELHARCLKPKIDAHPNSPCPDRPLRIGYLSPDFRDHVIGRNVLPLLRNHDHTQFEIFAYARLNRRDHATSHFQNACDHWRDITGLPDAQVASLVAADQIDILVDLAMHLAGNVLSVMARRPAPIQITFAAYPGSTGLSAIDYRITDPHLDAPTESAIDFAEQPLRLPSTFWCYDPNPFAADPSELPLVSLLPAESNGHLTFGCLCDFCKISPMSLALWARVLNSIPTSRMILLAPDGDSRIRLLQQFGSLGVAPHRLLFVSRQRRLDYLRICHLIDIALDTLPYNGHTTSLDALWMGVPVITRVGSTTVGRAGLSQMTNLNLPELIARTDDQFVEIAQTLAADLPRLGTLRQTLRPRMEQSPLMDPRSFARDIENLYRAVWKTWGQRRAPIPARVEVATFVSTSHQPDRIAQ